MYELLVPAPMQGSVRGRLPTLAPSLTHSAASSSSGLSTSSVNRDETAAGGRDSGSLNTQQSINQSIE